MKIEALEPRANSWLRWAALQPESRLFEVDGGVMAVNGTTAKLATPMANAAARALAAASATTRIEWLIGPEDAVRAFVEAHPEHFERHDRSLEMALDGDPQRPLVAGEGRALGGGAFVPPPFDEWLQAFSAQRFGTPSITANDLWGWFDGPARAMAGAFRCGESDLRIVTVYTPPSERGRGYAGALVAAIGAHAVSQRIANVTLNVEMANIPARRAYERAGFRAIAEAAVWRRAAASCRR